MSIFDSKLGPIVLKNWVSSEWCDVVINSNANSIVNYRSYQGVVDLNKRNAKYCIIDDIYRDPFVQFEQNILCNIFSMKVDFLKLEPIILYKYANSCGFVMHHDEVTTVELSNANINSFPIFGGDVTNILYLSRNDSYVGGEIYFPDHGVSVKPDIGTLISYRANRQNLHCVMPIIHGARYAVVCRSNILV